MGFEPCVISKFPTKWATTTAQELGDYSYDSYPHVLVKDIQASFLNAVAVTSVI